MLNSKEALLRSHNHFVGSSIEGTHLNVTKSITDVGGRIVTTLSFDGSDDRVFTTSESRVDGGKTGIIRHIEKGQTHGFIGAAFCDGGSEILEKSVEQNIGY